MRKLPTKVKEQRGTLQKCRTPKGEVEFTEVVTEKSIPVLTWWPPNVQETFKFYYKELKKVGLLFKTDLLVLERFCFAIHQAQEAEKGLIEDGFLVTKTNVKGDTYETASDWISILKAANATIDRYSSKFGFSPVDKTRIELQAIEKEEKQSLLR